GTTAAYISYFPDIGAPGAPEAIEAFAQAALDVGAHRLVLLSGRGEDAAQRAEQAVQDSGAAWTIVRCSWFNQNFSESVFLGPVLAGQVGLPPDTIPEPFLDADDVADVAVAVLTEEGHADQVYELTGPRLLTWAEAVGEIAKASGRDIRYVPISLEQFTAGLAEAGEPEELVSLLAYLFAEVMDGRNASLTDGVQRALGREPRGFADYARAAAATGVWAGELAGHR
ncbi:MAG: NmrA family transcriptional regulator, partial [Actinomycetota bacterium]|nr:NmrA family transcriptional regulator [Actinomycetota bacterium]